MNLTDRQVELIEDLLITYTSYRKWLIEKYGDEEWEVVDFVFNNKTYIILEFDYKKVCEIIDYIKGVKSYYDTLSEIIDYIKGVKKDGI